MTKSNKQLNRIPSKGKIAGVCAGVAEFLGIETWLVRIVWFTGLVLSGGFFFIAYIACWFILDKAGPETKSKNPAAPGDQWHRFDGNEDIDRAVEVKSKVWQAGEPPKQAFRDIARQFEGIERRVRIVEGYVTSNEYTLKREINRL